MIETGDFVEDAVRWSLFKFLFLGGRVVLLRILHVLFLVRINMSIHGCVTVLFVINESCG